jgi:hypothetical protein
LAVAGRYAYVAGRSLWVIDVADPLNPAVVGGAELSWPPTGIAVAGNHVFLSEEEHQNGEVAHGFVEAFDVTDPRNPVPVALAATKGSAEDVAVAGNRLLVADGVWGLTVWDASAFLGERVRLLPLQAEGTDWRVTFTGTPGAAYRVEVSEDSTGPWVPAASVVATNGVGVWTDRHAPIGRGFDRVVRPSTGCDRGAVESWSSRASSRAAPSCSEKTVCLGVCRS